MGVIIPQKVSVLVSGKIEKHLKNIGYNVKKYDKIEIDVEHLTESSGVYVKCKCDYCGKELFLKNQKITEIRDSINSKICCLDCVDLKKKESNRIKKDKKQNLCMYDNYDYLYNEYIINDKSAKQIALENKVNIRTIYKHISKNNLSKKVDIDEEDEYDIIISYTILKMTLEEICKEFSIGYNRLKNILNMYNIKIRDLSESCLIYYYEKDGIKKQTEVNRKIWSNDSFRENHKMIMNKICSSYEHRIKQSCGVRKIDIEDFDGFLSSENDLIRNSKEYKNWVFNIFERDFYTCQICGRKSRKGDSVSLEAHHLNSFNKHVDKRFDINNGVTLCRECHSPKIKNSFHNIYGTKDFTEEDFYEYKSLKNRIKGEKYEN